MTIIGVFLAYVSRWNVVSLIRNRGIHSILEYPVYLEVCRTVIVVAVDSIFNESLVSLSAPLLLVYGRPKKNTAADTLKRGRFNGNTSEFCTSAEFRNCFCDERHFHVLRRL
jgi:hypothetical protein